MVYTTEQIRQWREATGGSFKDFKINHPNFVWKGTGAKNAPEISPIFLTSTPTLAILKENSHE